MCYRPILSFPHIPPLLQQCQNSGCYILWWGAVAKVSTKKGNYHSLTSVVSLCSMDRSAQTCNSYFGVTSLPWPMLQDQAWEGGLDIGAAGAANPSQDLIHPSPSSSLPSPFPLYPSTPPPAYIWSPPEIGRTNEDGGRKVRCSEQCIE